MKTEKREYQVSSSLPPLSACRLEAPQELLVRLRAHESDPALAEFLCPICMGIFWKPVRTACGHAFCKECLIQSLLAQVSLRQGEPSCPLCRCDLDVENEHTFAIDESLVMRMRLILTAQENNMNSRSSKPSSSVARLCRGGARTMPGNRYLSARSEENPASVSMEQDLVEVALSGTVVSTTFVDSSCVAPHSGPVDNCNPVGESGLTKAGDAKVQCITHSSPSSMSQSLDPKAKSSAHSLHAAVASMHHISPLSVHCRGARQQPHVQSGGLHAERSDIVLDSLGSDLAKDTPARGQARTLKCGARVRCDYADSFHGLIDAKEHRGDTVSVFADGCCSRLRCFSAKRTKPTQLHRPNYGCKLFGTAPLAASASDNGAFGGLEVTPTASFGLAVGLGEASGAAEGPDCEAGSRHMVFPPQPKARPWLTPSQVKQTERCELPGVTAEGLRPKTTMLQPVAFKSSGRSVSEQTSAAEDVNITSACIASPNSTTCAALDVSPTGPGNAQLLRVGARSRVGHKCAREGSCQRDVCIDSQLAAPKAHHRPQSVQVASRHTSVAEGGQMHNTVSAIEKGPLPSSGKADLSAEPYIAHIQAKCSNSFGENSQDKFWWRLGP